MFNKKSKIKSQTQAQSKQENSGNQKKKGGAFRFMYKTFFNVPAWIGFKQIRDSNRVIMSYVKESFHIDEEARAESFEEAVARQGLSKEQLIETYKNNTRNFYLLLAVVILLAIYAIYLLIFGMFKGFFVDLAVIVFACVKLFQFSFWNFQIRNKKLGCSFREWMTGKVRQ